MFNFTPYIEEALDAVEEGGDDEYIFAVVFEEVSSEALAEGLLGDSVPVEHKWLLAAAAGSGWRDDLLPILREVRWCDDELLHTFADWAVKRFDRWDSLDDFWRALSVWAETIRPEFEQLCLF